MFWLLMIWGLLPWVMQKEETCWNIEDRHGSALPLSPSMPIDNWHEQIGSHHCDAILDRLIHNAHKIHLKGKSMRKKELKEN